MAPPASPRDLLPGGSSKQPAAVDWEDHPLTGHAAYRVLQALDDSRARTVLAEHRATGELVVVELLDCRGGEAERQALLEQYRGHSSLLHPHIIALREVFCCGDHLLGVVVEYVEGATLLQHAKRRGGLPEGEARWLLQQAVLALDYAHRRGVASSGLQAEHTLLELRGEQQPLLKLRDFGLRRPRLALHSYSVEPAASNLSCAPEVISNCKGYDPRAACVWSAGVLLYVMLFATYPFQLPGDRRLHPFRRASLLIQRILQADYELPCTNPISDGCRDLLRRMLAADPAKRATAREILEHPWYCQGLPAGAREYNASLAQLHVVPRQTEAEVVAILEQVYMRHKPAAAAAAERSSGAAVGESLGDLG